MRNSGTAGSSLRVQQQRRRSAQLGCRRTLVYAPRSWRTVLYNARSTCAHPRTGFLRWMGFTKLTNEKNWKALLNVRDALNSLLASGSLDFDGLSEHSSRSYDEDHCMGIELNIWECAKVTGIIVISVLIVMIQVIHNIRFLFRYGATSCTRWWMAGASMGDLMRLITEGLSTGTPASWADRTSFQCYPTNLRNFLWVSCFPVL